MVPFSLLSATFSLSLPEPSSTQLFSWGVVFWAVCRVRIRSLVSFFSSGLFFGLPMFRVSVLSNLQERFHIISSFGGLFLFLSHFSDCVDFSYSEGSFFLFFSRIFHGSSTVLFFLSGSVLSSRAALSSNNACHQFLCRWHVTPTVMISPVMVNRS